MPGPVVDVFVSYSKKDATIAGALVTVLEEQGWSVWWDRDLLGGDSYAEVIADALDRARCAVVLWTANASTSRWVAGEIETAANRNVLVPIQFDQTPKPLSVRTLQWESLTGWKGDARDTRVDKILRSIGAMIGRQPALPDRAPNVTLRWAAFLGLISTPIFAVGMVSTREPNVPIDLRAEVSGVGFRTSAATRLFLDDASVREVEASEISRVDRTRAAGSYPASHVALYQATEGDVGPGAEIEPLSLGPGSAVSVATLPGGGNTIDIEAPAFEDGAGHLGMLALVPMRMELFDDATQLPVFHTVEVGERFDVLPSAHLLRITVYGGRIAIATNVAVDSLRLAQLNQRDPESHRVPSGLLSGVIRLGNAATDTVRANDRIRISGLRGDLRTLAVDSSGRLRLEFQGTVSSVLSVSGPPGEEVIEDLMGGPLWAFWNYERDKSVVALIAYFLVAAAVALYWWREPVWWWKRRTS